MGALEGEGDVGFCTDDGGGSVGEGDHLGRIEHAQAEAEQEAAGEGAVESFFGEQFVVDGIDDGLDGGAGIADDIEAGVKRVGDGLFEGAGDMLAAHELRDAGPVGDDRAVEAPLVAEEIGEEPVIGGTGDFVDAAEGGHGGGGMSLDEAGAKGGEVIIVEQFFGDHVLVAHAVGFLAVDGEVLGRGDGFQIFRVVALQALDHGDADAAGESGVFAEGFLDAAPARVAGQVDGGGPEHEAAVALAVGVVFGAGLIGDGVADFLDEVGVEGGGQADGLGIDGGAAGAGDAVDGLGPPVDGGDVEAVVVGDHHLDLFGFFFEGEAADEVGDALFEGEGGVFVGRVGRRVERLGANVARRT